MKKNLIFLFIIFSIIVVFGNILYANNSGVPDEVIKKIRKDSRRLDNSERNIYVMLQKNSYLSMMKKFEKYQLSQEEIDKILMDLNAMYGSNYEKQNQVVEREIKDYKTMEKAVEKEVNKRVESIISQKKIENNSLNAVKIPQEVLEIYQNSAKELFPNDEKQQEKYMNICVRDYYKILKYIR